MPKSRKGVAAFEWILLLVSLVIGIVGGLAIIRDALVIECAEVADAILHHNKSYYISPSLVAEMKIDEGTIASEASGSVESDEVLVEEKPSLTGGTRYIDGTNNVGENNVVVGHYDLVKEATK